MVEMPKKKVASLDDIILAAKGVRKLGGIVNSTDDWPDSLYEDLKQEANDLYEMISERLGCDPSLQAEEFNVLYQLQRATVPICKYRLDYFDKFLNALDAVAAWCHRQWSNQEKDERWSEAKPPSEWAKQFRTTVKTLNRHADAGKLVIDRITTKSWRIRLDTLERYTGK